MAHIDFFRWNPLDLAVTPNGQRQALLLVLQNRIAPAALTAASISVPFANNSEILRDLSFAMRIVLH